MATGDSTDGTDRPPFGKFVMGFITLFPALTALFITVLLILNSQLSFTSLSDPLTLNSLAMVVLFSLTGLAVGYGVRQLLAPDWSSTGGAQDGRYRDRLARYVVTAGTVGIFITAVCLIIAVAYRNVLGWEDKALSVFTSILPVFATWVGTVLAFYFTNETVRRTQASQSQAANNNSDPITRPGTMVPFENIARIEMDPAAVASHGSAAAAAGAIDLEEIQDLFGPAGTNRVVIFDDNKSPVFVIHRSAMPPVLATGDTVEDYLATGTNREAAVKFVIVAASTPLANARTRLETGGYTDLFVTERGGSQEPTLGWVPDENLRRS